MRIDFRFKNENESDEAARNIIRCEIDLDEVNEKLWLIIALLLFVLGRVGDQEKYAISHLATVLCGMAAAVVYMTYVVQPWWESLKRKLKRS